MEVKKNKQKNYAAINGSCKMAKLTDGLSMKECPKCKTVHSLRICPMCGHKRVMRVQQKIGGKDKKGITQINGPKETLLTTSDICHLFRIKKRTVHLWVQLKRIPVPIKSSPREAYWRASEIKKALAGYKDSTCSKHAARQAIRKQGRRNAGKDGGADVFTKIEHECCEPGCHVKTRDHRCPKHLADWRRKHGVRESDLYNMEECGVLRRVG
jgi:predicted DNA-binding transcriptional regulator AlpA